MQDGKGAGANTGAGQKPRVVIGDDHALVVEGLRRILETECDIVATVSDGRSLMRAVHELDPDVILLDISMPGLNGLEAARQLKREESRARIVFVTMHSDADYLREALQAGAAGFVPKRSAYKELLAAVREVTAGGTYVPPELGHLLRTSGSSPAAFSNLAHGPLTRRQREVLQLIAEGHSSKAIAATLNISVKTVEFHKNSIHTVLGLRTTAELTRYALEHRIVGSEAEVGDS